MSKKCKSDKQSEIVQDDDLITIKTIKEKHLDQILEPLDPGFKEEGVEFLYYVNGRDAILARDKGNGRLRAIRAISIIMGVVENPAVTSDTLTVARDAARARIHCLPQLFTD
jgi:hypothetical protein